jgi:hypothetical protein
MESQLQRMRMIVKADSPPGVSPTACNQCGGSLRLLYTILDPTTGKQVRTFKWSTALPIRTWDVTRR